MRTALVGCVLLLSGFTAGCYREPPSAPAVSSAEPTRAAPAFDPDRRAPLPLLPMMAHHQKQSMRDHLVAVQGVVLALASNDFDGMVRAASRLGSSEQMGQMCSHLGSAATGFTEQALAFHRTADGIAAAARARDATRVLSELGATLATCTSCHETWKQLVVDEVTWQRLTSSREPSHERVERTGP